MKQSKSPTPQKAPRKVPAVERIIASVGSVPSLIFHSVLFSGFLLLTIAAPFPRDLILLVWNTIVSLEAIYLAIFIQFSVNRNTESLREVEEDIDEIQEDVEELNEEEEGTEAKKEVTEKKKKPEKTDTELLAQLTTDVQRLLSDLEALKKRS